MKSRVVDISSNQSKTSAWNEDDGQELESLGKKYDQGDFDESIIETEILPTTITNQDGDSISIKSLQNQPTESPPVRIIRGKVPSPKARQAYVPTDKSPKSIKSYKGSPIKDISEGVFKSPKNQLISPIRLTPVATPRKIRSPSPDKSHDLSHRSQDASLLSQDVSRVSSATVHQSSAYENVDNKKIKESSASKHVDNIRMRIQAAKERAGVLSQVKPRYKKKTPASSIPSSSVSNLLKDDDEVEVALNKHKEARKKWKNLAIITKQVSSFEAEFDFFTRGSNSNKSNDLHESQEKSSIKDETPTDDGSLDEEVRLVTERSLIKYRQASPEPPDTKDKLRAILFCPSSSPVPIEEKLEGERLPRFIADEGLYVGEKTHISQRSKNKLEQRIMASGSERIWFGEDGELKCLTQEISIKCVPALPPTEPIDTLLTYMPPCLGWPAVSLESVITPNQHVTNDFVLQIDVGRVIIRHHTLFTHEHYLANNISNIVHNLDRREKEGLIYKLGARIEAICDSRHQSNLLWKQSNDPIQKYRMNIYSKEVRRLGLQWIKEIKMTNEMTREATELWKELAVLRQRQGFASTDLHVIMTRTRPSSSETESRYGDLLSRVRNEIKGEKEARIKKRKEEKRRRKIEELRSDADDNSDCGSPQPSSSEDEDTQRNDDDVGDDSFDVDLDLDPKVRLTLSHSSRYLQQPPPPSSYTQNYEKEFGRGILICLRLNNKEIGRAMGRPQPSERPSFAFNVQHRFSVKLTSKPNSLSIQLFLPRRAVTASQLLALVNLPLPSRLQTDEVSWQEVDWSAAETGWISGSVSIRSGWQEQIPHFFYDSKSISKLGTSFDEGGGDVSFDLSSYDPNNPSNDPSKQNDKKDNEGFRLNPLQDEFDFCSEKDLESDPRLRLLMLRDRGEPEFVNVRAVPLNPNHLQPNIFKAYERRISGKTTATGTRNATIVPSSGLSPFDALRSRGYQAYEELKSNVFNQLESHNKRTTAHYVNEPPIYDFYMLMNAFLRWMQPKRASKPTRADSQRVPVRSLIGQQVEVLLTVVRGLQIPIRSDSDWKSCNPDGISTVRPFVEVAYKNSRQRTFTADGANPTWNHQIHIPLKVSEDKTLPDGGNLEITLYDEIVEDLINEDRQRENEIHLNRQRCYLGRITIPVQVIVTNPWIEGTFEVIIPSSLLGYARESKELGDKTYLNLQIEVQPTLTTVPPRIKEELIDSIELPELHSHLKNWSQCIKQDLPGITFHALVITSRAKTVCPTRFISPLFPPVMYPGHPTTAEMAARFVSLIPTAIKTPLNQPVDVWLTADELVGGCCGERKDKAVLLTCYFLGLGLKAWLCLGQALPQGICHWVVTKDTGKEGRIQVWDPDSGSCYSAGEPFCPLIKPHCIIDSTNIWVNEDERPGWDGRLELSNWRVCLGRSFQAPGTLQPPTMAYMETPDPTVLQDKLNKLLRHAIMKLRPTTRTIWNRYCSSALTKLLPGLERESWLGNRLSPSYTDQFTHISSSYKVYGVALNSPYTNSADAVQMIKSCGIHLNTNPNTEFALAVYLHSYPSSVLSLWIYMAALQTRR